MREVSLAAEQMLTRRVVDCCGVVQYTAHFYHQSSPKYNFTYRLIYHREVFYYHEYVLHQCLTFVVTIY